MLCKIYRWKVSGAIDSGKPVPDAVKRHLLRCASCREFAAAAEDMGRELSREAGVLIDSPNPALEECVKASLRETAPSPGDADMRVRSMRSLRFAWDDASSSGPGSAPGARPRPGFRLSPILAAAAALLVIGAGVLYMVRSRPQAVPEPAPAFRIEQPGKYLVAAVQKVNSPYEKEMQLWKQTLDSAAEKLKQSFDLGLGEAQ